MQKYFEDLKAELAGMARDNPHVRKALDVQRQYGLTDAETFIALSHYLVREFEAMKRIAVGMATEPLKPFAVAAPFVVKDIWAGSQPGEPGLRIQDAAAPDQVDYEGFIATGVRGSGKTAAQLREMRQRGGF